MMAGVEADKEKYYHNTMVINTQLRLFRSSLSILYML